VRSRFGLVLQGIRQNERRMAAIGVAPYRIKLAAFVIAGAGAGLAGALDANLLRFVSPDLLAWSNSGDMMVMVVIGGAGSLFGAVLGAAVMIALQSVLAQWTDHWMIVMGPFLVLFILFIRNGFWGLLGGAGARR
jgi:branched-chain amino acid transport system permease protein